MDRTELRGLMRVIYGDADDLTDEEMARRYREIVRELRGTLRKSNDRLETELAQVRLERDDLRRQLAEQWRPVTKAVHCACGEAGCQTVIYPSGPDEPGHATLFVEHARRAILFYLPDDVRLCRRVPVGPKGPNPRQGIKTPPQHAPTKPALSVAKGCPGDEPGLLL